MHWSKVALPLVQGDAECPRMKTQRLHNAAILSWKPKSTRKAWKQQAATSALVALLRVVVVPACAASRAKAQVYRDPKEQVPVASGRRGQVPHLQAQPAVLFPRRCYRKGGLQISGNSSAIPPASFSNSKTCCPANLLFLSHGNLLSVFMSNHLPAEMVKILIVCLSLN